MKNILRNLYWGLVILSFHAKGQAVVNLAKTNQVIDGFGASSAWSGAIGDNIMTPLYGDLGFSILRLRIEEGIGDGWKTGNFSAWAAELSNAKKASAKGAIVFASPWNPPASMQESFTSTADADAKRLRYDKYAEYTDYLNAYVKYMKDNGVNLYAISVQNEPDYAYDWTWWTPAEMLNFMKNYAGSINCKVIAPESFQYLKNMSDPILNDATALSNLDILGFHLYGTPVGQYTYPLLQQNGAGKKAWMTEHYFDTDGITDIMGMSKEIHNCMMANMNAYVYWWIPYSNGLANTNGTIYKRAYVLGQFSKFIRPGYYRVNATATPASNVYISAYKGSDKVVIVAVNAGTSAVNQEFDLQNGAVSKVTPYITDNSRNLVAGSSVSLSNNSFTAQLPPQSISTFVGDLGNVPQVIFTSPARTGAYTAGTPVSLAADATIVTGSIVNVAFYDGSALLSTDNSAPYSYTWTNPSAGKHLLKVVATDNSGNTAFDTLTIKVNVPQGPYNGIVHVIPGTIQAEEYDAGGNGFAYYDVTAGNAGGASFRTDEDVDLENCTDTGGGYNLGWATAGEWLEYAVNVQTTGVYNMDLRVACNGDGRTLSVSMDGTDIAGNVAIPNTTGWQTWQTVRVSNISLTAGQKILRITIGATDYINLNYVAFSLYQPPIATITAAGATTFCAGGSVMLNAGTGTGYTYQWNKDGSNIANATASSYPATQSGSYTVTVSANGQTATSTAVSVTVNALPVITPYVQINGGAWLQQNTAQLCAGSSVVLGPQPLSATGWSWTGPDGYTSASRVVSLATISSAQGGVYAATYTSNGCMTKQTFSITVDSLPDAPTVNSPVAYCQNSAATQLVASGTNLKWYTVPGGGTFVSTAPTPSTATAGATNYYVSQTSNGCESSRAVIAVTINPLPEAVITPSGPTTFVEGGSVTLNANMGAGLSYAWFNGATQVGTGVSYKATSTGSYTVEVTNASGCKATSIATNVTVNSNQPSVITIVSPVPNSTVSGAITITATVSDPDGAITKVEYLDGTTVVGTSTTAPYGFILDNPTVGDHVITVRVTDSNGGVTTSAPVTVTSGVSTGIHAMNELHGVIYPNPANGEITVETAMDLADAKVSVINVFGEEVQLVPVVNGRGANVDVSSLTGGTYLLVVSIENALLKKKITVVK